MYNIYIYIYIFCYGLTRLKGQKKLEGMMEGVSEEEEDDSECGAEFGKRMDGIRRRIRKGRMRWCQIGRRTR